MGAWVLISETWYKAAVQKSAGGAAALCCRVAE